MRRAKPPKTDPTAEELSGRTALSIKEATILTGRSRPFVISHMNAGNYRWFWDGCHKRIITKSIFEYQDRQAKEAMDGS